MSVYNINLNPFRLTNTREQWNEKGISSASRVVKTGSSLVKELFVDNPTRLTVGNIKNGFFSPVQKTKLEKAAAIGAAAVGSIYSLMLYGSSTFFMGKSIVAAGEGTGIVSLTKVGAFFQLWGERIFLAGAVPVYGILYALPKKIIEFTPKIVEALAEKVMVAAQWIFKTVLVPIWDHVIYPILSLCDRVFTEIGKVLSSIGKALLEQITNVANWVFQNLIQPLWQHLVKPVLTSVGQIIDTVMVPVVKFVAEKISVVANWLIDNVLGPVFQSVEIAAFYVGKLLLDHVILPLANHVLIPIAKLTASVVQLIFKNMIVPVSQMMGDVGDFVGARLYEICKIVQEIASSGWRHLFG